MNSYEGKHIWIIGASSGIGRALAFELAAQGAILVLSARSEDKLQALRQELGGAHIVLSLDVSDEEAVVKAAQSITHIDSVIFMAAIYEPAPLSKLQIKSVHKMVNINLNGAFNIVHAVLPIMKAQAEGQIVLCGSVAGYRGLPKGQPYSATKAAVINLAESLRAEEPYLDIKVINPGFVRTPLTNKNDFKMPMMIEPEEAAKTIARELQTGCFEIHFPKRFTFLMKFLAVLPSFLYFKFVRRF